MLHIRMPIVVRQTFLYHIPDALVKLRVCGNALREGLRRAVKLVSQEFDDLAVSEGGQNAEDKIDDESGHMRYVRVHNLEDRAFRPWSTVYMSRMD